MPYYRHAFDIDTDAQIDGAINATADLLTLLEATPVSELSSFRNAFLQYMKSHKGMIDRAEKNKTHSPVALLRSVLISDDFEDVANIESEFGSLKGELFSFIQRAAHSTLEQMNLPTKGFHFLDDVALIYSTHR